MKKTKITTLALTLIMACSLLIGCGASEADKAFDEWANGTSKRMMESDATFKLEFTADADTQTKLDALDKHLSVYKPSVEELASIDESKLTGERKTFYTEHLKGFEDIVAEFESIREQLIADLEAEQGYEEYVEDEDGAEE